jgi:hypothetical protein
MTTFLADLGNSHIIAWYLHRALRNACPTAIDLWSRHPARYADWDEELEGLYR